MGRRIDWAQMAAHHWVLSQTLTQSANLHGKDPAHKKDILKDARAHREIAERLGDVAYEEAVSLLQRRDAGTLDEDADEDADAEVTSGDDAPPVEELEPPPAVKLPPRKRPRGGH